MLSCGAIHCFGSNSATSNPQLAPKNASKLLIPVPNNERRRSISQVGLLLRSFVAGRLKACYLEACNIKANPDEKAV
jgi:hypothetical protein